MLDINLIQLIVSVLSFVLQFACVLFIVYLLGQLRRKSEVIEKLKKEKKRLITKMKKYCLVFDDSLDENKSDTASGIVMPIDMFKSGRYFKLFERLDSCVKDIDDTISDLKELYRESLANSVENYASVNIFLPNEIREFLRDMIRALYSVSESVNLDESKSKDDSDT